MGCEIPVYVVLCFVVVRGSHGLLIETNAAGPRHFINSRLVFDHSFAFLFFSVPLSSHVLLVVDVIPPFLLFSMPLLPQVSFSAWSR